MNPNIDQVLKALGEALKMPLPDELVKAWVQAGSPTSGITAYDLEAPAKHLFPVLTPLRNEIPRVGGGVGTAVNWRAVTGINTNNMEAGVSEGNRGGVIAHTTADYTAAYKGIGLEDNVTFEAEYAGNTFDDVKALAVMGLLNALMIQEEILLLGGDNSLALGTTPTPAAAGAITGGSLAAATYSVICVALTMNGVNSGSVAGGIRAAVSRTNADGSTDNYGGGSAQKSAAVSATVASGSAGSISATVAPVSGAAGYAWFWGAAGAEVLGAITSLNSILITANATGTQTATSLPSSDNSRNTLAFDGILTQCYAPGSGALILTQPSGTAGTGTPLTSDNFGGIVEFDQVLKDRWDNFRLSPDTIWVASQEQQYIQGKILGTNASNAAQRFVFNVSQNKIMGGTLALSYLNKFGVVGQGAEYGQGKEIPIRIHPFMPAGTILFTSKSLPYKLNNVANVIQVKTRRDYYQLEWPLRTRKYEYGVYSDEVLQNYFPPAFAVIRNVGKG